MICVILSAVVGSSEQPVLFCQFDVTYGPGPCIVESPIQTSNILEGHLCFSYNVSSVNVFINFALLFLNGTKAISRTWYAGSPGISYEMQCISLFGTSPDVAPVLQVTARSFFASPHAMEWALIFKSEVFFVDSSKYIYSFA